MKIVIEDKIIDLDKTFSIEVGRTSYYENSIETLVFKSSIQETIIEKLLDPFEYYKPVFVGCEVECKSFLRDKVRSEYKVYRGVGRKHKIISKADFLEAEKIFNNDWNELKEEVFELFKNNKNLTDNYKELKFKNKIK